MGLQPRLVGEGNCGPVMLAIGGKCAAMRSVANLVPTAKPSEPFVGECARAASY
jgi:hypothetical protein